MAGRGRPHLCIENLSAPRRLAPSVVSAIQRFGQSAHIWRRSGVTVEATNSHSDFFVKNLSMLRAEERLGLGVFRPVAFTEVRGLT